MRKKIYLISMIGILVVVLATCRHVGSSPSSLDVTNQFICPESAQAQTNHLIILHTNDHHGRFWQNRYGEWGMAARKTLVDRIRKEAAQSKSCVLLLSAGDIFTGTPISDFFKAEPDFLGMKMIGYNAMAIGNHEFDQGLAALLDRQKETAHQFPFLSGNIFDRNNKLLFGGEGHGEISFNVKGAKVVVWGLTTPDTVLPKGEQLKLQLPVEAAKMSAKKVKEKAHVLIGLTHMGHYPEEMLTEERQGDIMLAKKVPGVFDIIIGGHSQEPLFEPVLVPDNHPHPTSIVQAYEWGKYLGRIDLVIKKNPILGQNNIESLQYRLIPINHKNNEADSAFCFDRNNEVTPCLEENEQVKEQLSKYQFDERMEPLNEKLGTSLGLFDGSRKIIRSQRNALSSLIDQAIRSKACKLDSLVCKNPHFTIYIGGAIRASLDKGPILGMDMSMVFPFKATLVTSELDGADLIRYFKSIFLLYRKSAGTGNYPHVYGLSWKISEGKLLSLHYRDESGQWQTVKPGRKYYLSTGSYIANGADRGAYPVLDGTDSGITMADVLREYVKEHQILDPSQYSVQPLEFSKH